MKMKYEEQEKSKEKKHIKYNDKMSIVFVKTFYTHPKKTTHYSYQLIEECGVLFKNLLKFSEEYFQKSTFYFYDYRNIKKQTIKNRIILGYHISPYDTLKQLCEKFSIKKEKEEEEEEKDEEEKEKEKYNLVIYQSCIYKYMPIFRIKYAVNIFNNITSFPPCDNFYEEEAINLLYIGEIDRNFFKTKDHSQNNCPENLIVLNYPGGARKAVNRKNLMLYLKNVLTTINYDIKKGKKEPKYIIDPISRVEISTDFARTIYQIIIHVTEPFYTLDLQ